MAKVNFYKDQTTFALKERAKLRKFIEDLFMKEGKELKLLNYILCNDEKLHSINKEYLAHDYYTDIITFDLSGEPGVIEGDVYISVDRVKENAGKFEVSASEEMSRVIFHGALHLCGYNDKTKKQQSEMRIKENEYLNSYYK